MFSHYGVATSMRLRTLSMAIIIRKICCDIMLLFLDDHGRPSVRRSHDHRWSSRRPKPAHVICYVLIYFVHIYFLTQFKLHLNTSSEVVRLTISNPLVGQVFLCGVPSQKHQFMHVDRWITHGAEHTNSLTYVMWSFIYSRMNEWMEKFHYHIVSVHTYILCHKRRCAAIHRRNAGDNRDHVEPGLFIVYSITKSDNATYCSHTTDSHPHRHEEDQQPLTTINDHNDDQRAAAMIMIAIITIDNNRI